jgi:hypothetical protein
MCEPHYSHHLILAAVISCTYLLWRIASSAPPASPYPPRLLVSCTKSRPDAALMRD